ncbi:hypothetical protein [Amorphus sp. MBR-141]
MVDTTLDDEAQIPFGGVKDRGYGRSGGLVGLEEFTELQWITIEGPNAPSYPFPSNATPARFRKRYSPVLETAFRCPQDRQQPRKISATAQTTAETTLPPPFVSLTPTRLFTRLVIN